MIILKLGGSALTVKDADSPTLDEENLNRIAEEVSYYNDDMVIVHGAGSYGHIYAKLYKIGDKLISPRDNLYKIEGMCTTQASMQLFNHMIITKLQERGIPAVGIKPSSFIMTKDKRIDICDARIVQRYVDEGFVPVLYGDAVLDLNPEIKFAILSGDQLITYLAKELKCDRVILSSDVDGIYTDNPKNNPDAELMEVVTRDTKLNFSSNKDQVDVTGGMEGKINELLSLADEGIESLIINAEVEGNIQQAVSGQKVKGTIIR